MEKSNKVKNVKKVTFTEDYGRHKKDDVIYPHFSIAEKIKKGGAKVKIESYNYEEAVEKAKKIKSANKEIKEKSLDQS